MEITDLSGIKATYLDPATISSLFRGREVQAPSVLMFSGGRDSTLAAIRMHEQGLSPILITVASGHLVGLDRVRKRVKEIAGRTCEALPWLVIRQPEELRTDTSFYERTCLPCHHAYVVVGGAVAAKSGISIVAFGYARYQNAWPEQTPVAIGRLRNVLSRHGTQLILPVYDLTSREEAMRLLAEQNQNPSALEQKCIRQVTNVSLDEAQLIRQVELWEHAIDASMSALGEIDIEVIEVIGASS